MAYHCPHSNTQPSKAMLILQSDYVRMLLLSYRVGPHMGHPWTTFRSWRGSVSFISSYITRCDESWKTKPWDMTAMAHWERKWLGIRISNTKWTDIKGLCQTKSGLWTIPQSPHFSKHATNILRHQSYEHVRRDSQESPNGVNNACSRQEFFFAKQL